MDEQVLREKLRKIEALFAGAGTAGERQAAEAARERIRARLAELARHDAPVAMQFSLLDRWQRRLFVALARRYGLSPYRLPRQRQTSVMLRVPKSFAEQVLWPEFLQLAAALEHFLDDVTTRVISDCVHRDSGDAVERAA
jgi:hypothetical protein